MKKKSPWCKCKKNVYGLDGFCIYCKKPVRGHSARIQKKFGYPLPRKWYEKHEPDGWEGDLVNQL